MLPLLESLYLLLKVKAALVILDPAPSPLQPIRRLLPIANAQRPLSEASQCCNAMLAHGSLYSTPRLQTVQPRRFRCA